jgi:hypothetical protein
MVDFYLISTGLENHNLGGRYFRTKSVSKSAKLSSQMESEIKNIPAKNSKITIVEK